MVVAVVQMPSCSEIFVFLWSAFYIALLIFETVFSFFIYFASNNFDLAVLLLRISFISTVIIYSGVIAGFIIKNRRLLNIGIQLLPFNMILMLLTHAYLVLVVIDYPGYNVHFTKTFLIPFVIFYYVSVFIANIAYWYTIGSVYDSYYNSISIWHEL